MASNKNITMKEFNGTDYDTLYPKTLDSQGLLTGSNITDYKVNTVGEALTLIYNSITLQNPLKLKVLDPSGAVVVGSNILSGSSTLGITNSNGEANIYVPQGITSLTIQNTNGYANYNDTTIEIQSSWIGDGNYHEVSIGGLAENGIIRYTSSTQIKFSPSVKNVDACLVGGGGSGWGGNRDDIYSWPGGGSGGILNVFEITTDSNTNYNIIVGGVCGNSSFMNNVATGGKNGANGGIGGTPNGLNGSAGGKTTGIGTDGQSNTTISEFDDGVTFYGGSGASGDKNTKRSGGTPHGGDGGYGTTDINKMKGSDATGYGGGGGGSMSAVGGSPDSAGHGYQGLVAIRVHYN